MQEGNISKSQLTIYNLLRLNYLNSKNVFVSCARKRNGRITRIFKPFMSMCKTMLYVICPLVWFRLDACDSGRRDRRRALEVSLSYNRVRSKIANMKSGT